MVWGLRDEELIEEDDNQEPNNLGKINDGAAPDLGSDQPESTSMGDDSCSNLLVGQSMSSPPVHLGSEEPVSTTMGMIP